MWVQLAHCTAASQALDISTLFQNSTPTQYCTCPAPIGLNYKVRGANSVLSKKKLVTGVRKCTPFGFDIKFKTEEDKDAFVSRLESIRDRMAGRLCSLG